MTPLIEQLEIMVKVGHEDKAKYDAETDEIRKIQPQTLDTEYEILYREQLSDVLNNMLHELEKASCKVCSPCPSNLLQFSTSLLPIVILPLQLYL